MKNVQVCPNCNHENPIYKLNCNNCKAFLRTRIVNIDLWQTISSLLESPIKTFRSIIQAEHKNFVILLNFLIGIKFFLLAIILSSFSELNSFNSDYFLSNTGLVIGLTFLAFLILSFLITHLNKLFGIENRFKDNYAILNYSFIPLLMSLLILSPVHYALFGQYWFTYNPPPYVVKPLPAYILLFIEGLMLFWSFLLLVFGNYAQTKSKVYTLIISIAIYIAIGLFLFFFPFLPL